MALECCVWQYTFSVFQLQLKQWDESEYTNTAIHQYSNTPIQQYTNTAIHQYSNTPIQQYTNTAIHQYSNTPIHQYSNTPIQQYTNTQSMKNHTHSLVSEGSNRTVPWENFEQFYLKKRNLASQLDVVEGNINETVQNFTLTAWISPGATVLNKNLQTEEE